MTSDERPAWQRELDDALASARTPTPATAVLAGRAGTPEDAEALRSLIDWFAQQGQSPVVDVTGDDGAVACALAAAGASVTVLRAGRASQAVRATLEEQPAELRQRVTVGDAPPSHAGSVLLAGSPRAGPVTWQRVADPATPVRAAVDAEGLTALAAVCAVDEAEIVDGLARITGRLSERGAATAAEALTTTLADAARDQAAREQATADDEDASWRQASAERRAREAERNARESDKAARRTARKLERAERELDETERRLAETGHELADARSERDDARARAESEHHRAERCAAALAREQELRAAMRQRRWWRLGEVLASARRSPRGMLRAPADVVRALRRR